MLYTHASIEENYTSMKFAAPISKSYFCSNTCCPDYANTVLDRQSNWLSLPALLPSLLNTHVSTATAVRMGRIWLQEFTARSLLSSYSVLTQTENKLNKTITKSITKGAESWAVFLFGSSFPFLHSISWTHMQLVLVYISNSVGNKA